VPVLVVTEVAHLLAMRLGPIAEVRFLGDLASGALSTVDVEPVEWLRMAELVARYAGLALGTVNASVIADAERLGVATVATFDRRHLEVVRLAHCERLTLLPAWNPSPVSG
jgi:hypothetical protein